MWQLTLECRRRSTGDMASPAPTGVRAVMLGTPHTPHTPSVPNVGGHASLATPSGEDAATGGGGGSSKRFGFLKKLTRRRSDAPESGDKTPDGQKTYTLTAATPSGNRLVQLPGEENAEDMAAGDSHDA
jgi:hypothetical protein